MSTQRKQQYTNSGLKPALSGGPSAAQGPRHGGGLVSLGVAKVPAQFALASLVPRTSLLCTALLEEDTWGGAGASCIVACDTALMTGACAEEWRHRGSQGPCAQARQPSIAEKGGWRQGGHSCVAGVP